MITKILNVQFEMEPTFPILAWAHYQLNMRLLTTHSYFGSRYFKVYI